MRQYIRFFKYATCYAEIKLFQSWHVALCFSAMTTEMMNDKRTKADRCDKYNVEWLINLMRVERNEENSSRALLV